MAVIEDDEEYWKWIGPGRPDKVAGRYRRYFNKIEILRRGQTEPRVYEIGDPVVMAGDSDEPWVAQIVDLFQVREDDPELRQILRKDSRKSIGANHYELMRCTLRWFYTHSDMNKQVLRRSRLPKVSNEIWFSDHVERDGYNDIQVIEGLAFLFPSMHAMQAFEREPSRRFRRNYDLMRIVRCFVNSRSEDLPIRELEKGELLKLLQNPSTEKDLFENSRLRLYGSAGAVVKGLGAKKKKKHSTTLREPITLDEDRISPAAKRAEDTKEGIRRTKKEAYRESTSDGDRSRNRPLRRRKVIDDDDESPLPSQENTETNSKNKMDLSPDSRAKERERIEEVNDDVLDLVQDLNDFADDDIPMLDDDEDYPVADLQDNTADNREGKQRATNPSVRRDQSPKPPEVVIIDDNDSPDEEEETPSPPPPPPQRKKHLQVPRAGTTARRGGGTGTLGRGSSSGKTMPAFMPTSRKTKRVVDSKTTKTIAKSPTQKHVKHSKTDSRRVEDDLIEVPVSRAENLQSKHGTYAQGSGHPRRLSAGGTAQNQDSAVREKRKSIEKPPQSGTPTRSQDKNSVPRKSAGMASSASKGGDASMPTIAREASLHSREKERDPMRNRHKAHHSPAGQQPPREGGQKNVRHPSFSPPERGNKSMKHSQARSSSDKRNPHEEFEEEVSALISQLGDNYSRMAPKLREVVNNRIEDMLSSSLSKLFKAPWDSRRQLEDQEHARIAEELLAETRKWFLPAIQEDISVKR